MDNNTNNSSLAYLLFVLFIFIADADEQLSATDVDRLNRLLDHPEQLDDSALAVLRNDLQTLNNRYSEFWKAYQNKSLVRHPDTITNTVLRIHTSPEALDRQSLLNALEHFIAYIQQGASVLSKLGMRAGHPAKVQAATQALALLTHTLTLNTNGGTSVTSISLPSASATISAPSHINSDEKLKALWPAATISISEDNRWKRGKAKFCCVAVTPETHDVKTFSFAAIQEKLHHYKPGQFMTLELSIEGKTVRRSYTISSSPSRPHLLQITVKRVRGGLVSNWLHENMRQGFELTISGPHGEFNCFDAPSEKLLLISAGSGITPVMSMLRWLADTQSSCDIAFVTYIRTPADAIFEQELRYLGTRLGSRLRLLIMPKNVESGQAWLGPVGGFSIDTLKIIAPDLQDREVFVCGPAGFMDNVRNTLATHGHPPERYHQESFGSAPAALSTVSAPSTPSPIVASPVTPVVPVVHEQKIPVVIDAQKNVATSNMEVHFSKSGKTITCCSDDSLLDIAEANDIIIESSCRAGNCGTCKVKKLEGNVDMEGQQALSEADIADGYVLCCIGRATSKRVVLEI